VKSYESNLIFLEVGMSMEKMKINFIVDILALIFFLASAATGLIIFFFMPPGFRSGKLSFLGINKLIWVNWHSITSLIFIALALTHIVLHINWFVCVVKNVFKKSGGKEGR
jgi:hypothetical protein